MGAKAGSAKHAVENARAAELVLSEDEIAQIERVFPKGRPPKQLPTL